MAMRYTQNERTVLAWQAISFASGQMNIDPLVILKLNATCPNLMNHGPWIVALGDRRCLKFEFCNNLFRPDSDSFGLLLDKKAAA